MDIKIQKKLSKILDSLFLSTKIIYNDNYRNGVQHERKNRKIYKVSFNNFIDYYANFRYEIFL